MPNQTLLKKGNKEEKFEPTKQKTKQGNNVTKTQKQTKPKSIPQGPV